MIKALLLILRPVWAWERIAQSRRNWAFVLLVYLFPLLALSCAAEAYGLVRWGHLQGELSRVRPFTRGETIVFEAAQFLLWLIVISISAAVVKSVGETFHARHTYSQAFTVVAYSLSPLFLVRLLNAYVTPWGMSSWITWTIGILLSLGVLYNGIPKIMEPDPPSAFGLFLVGAVVLVFITGLAQLLAACYLQGRFDALQTAFSHLGEQLPF